VNLATFLIRYPEFGDGRAATDLIEQALDQASRAVSGDVWGSQLGDGRGLYAAHKLAVSPWGQQARLSDGFTSTYGKQFEKLQASIAPRMLVSRF
jgi:hypothetical protein